MSRLAVRTFALVLAVTSFGTPHVAAADAREQAAEHFKRGAQLYGEGDLRAALIEFHRAYELAPHHRALFNIGQVQYQLGDYAGALKTFSQYLEEGGSDIDPTRRQAVENDLELLRTRVAYVELAVDVSDAEVYLDDVAVALTPLAEPLVVSTGRRRITVRKQGYRAETAVIDVAGGDRRKLSLTLEKDPRVAPLPPPALPGTEAEVPWAAWATTAGFGVGWLVFGALALNAKSELSESKNQPTATRAALDAEQERLLAFSIASDLMAVGALVSGGVALYLTLTAGADDEPELAFSLGPAGIGLHGRF
jgi:tetratricopeptide (TPR) repeat protein